MGVPTIRPQTSFVKEMEYKEEKYFLTIESPYQISF